MAARQVGWRAASTTHEAKCTDCPEDATGQAEDLQQVWGEEHHDRTGHRVRFVVVTTYETPRRQ